MEAKNWAVDALCYDPTTGGPKLTCNLQIPVNGRSVAMPGTTVHAGMPVDANLAVTYMKNFLKHYRIRIVKPHEQIDELLLNKDLQGLHDVVKQSKDFHDNLVKLTYGMTLEKDMALRILSQPGCEGLRFYLCAKEIGEEEKWNMSLIVVGVDAGGVDLNYGSKDTIKPFNEAMPDGDDFDTQSLTGEYVTPPYDDGGGDGGSILLNKKYDTAKTAIGKSFHNCFVLLKLAKRHHPNQSGQNKLS